MTGLNEDLLLALIKLLLKLFALMLNDAAKSSVPELETGIEISDSTISWIVAAVATVVAALQYHASRKALKITREALVQNQKAMDSTSKSRRPWLHASATLAGDIKIENNRLIKIPLHVVVTNYGQDPAIYANIQIKCADGYSDWDIRIALNIDNRKRNVSSFESDTIFPHPSPALEFTEILQLNILTQQEFEANPRYTGKNYFPSLFGPRFILLSVAYNAPESKELMETLVIYRIYMKGKNPDNIEGAIPIRPVTKARDVVLTHFKTNSSIQEYVPSKNIVVVPLEKKQP